MGDRIWENMVCDMKIEMHYTITSDFWMSECEIVSESAVSSYLRFWQYWLLVLLALLVKWLMEIRNILFGWPLIKITKYRNGKFCLSEKSKNMIWSANSKISNVHNATFLCKKKPRPSFYEVVFKTPKYPDIMCRK